MFSFLVSILYLVSCKKNDVSVAMPSAIESAKVYLDSKVSHSANTNNITSDASSVLRRVSDVLDWSTASSLNIKGKSVVLVDIRDVGLAMSNKLASRRIVAFISDKAGGKIEMNILEVFGNINQEREIYGQKLLDLKVGGKLDKQGHRSENLILYNENYIRVKGNSIVLRDRIKDRRSGSGNDNPRDARQEFVTGQCQTWGVYMVTWDANGNEIDRVLLYTFNTGDCNLVLDAEFVAPDYGGGSNLNEDIDFHIAREFSKAISATSSPENFENYIEDPSVQGVVKWVIRRGNSWQIEALTQYAYSRIPYRDVNTLQSVPVFNFSKFSTISSRFVGSNMLVETTWVPSPPIDIVHNNNTGNAYGESWVEGAVNHKWKGAIGYLPVPDIVTSASNTMTLRPR
jgi:hypothetical protein